MPELTEAVQNLLEHPIRPTKPLETLVRRARSRRRRRRAAFATLAVAVVAGVLAGVFGEVRSSPSRPNVIVGGLPPLVVPITPAGWDRVSFANASVAVPANWRVLTTDEGACPEGNDVVLLGNAQTNVHCPPGSSAGPAPTSFVRFQQLTSSAPRAVPGQAPVDIGGHHGIRVYPIADSGPAYAFADLGVVVTLAGPDSATILNTIGWSQPYLVLHPSSPVKVPASWKTLTQDGVAFKVPAAWPISEPTCAPLSTPPPIKLPKQPQEFPTPGVIKGTLSGPCAPSGLPPSLQANIDGVYIRAYAELRGQPFPPHGSEVIQTAPIELLLLLQDPGSPIVPGLTAEPVMNLVAVTPTGAKIAIDIGLGTDPSVAREIIASLRATT